jgi:AcrR family transcriptional regulator
MKRRATGTTRVPQQSRAREKVDRLVAAAHTCFNTHGYAATTMAGIARKAKVSTGTAYAYFKDKDDLLARVLAAHADGVLSPAEEIVESLPARASLRRTLERMVAKALESAEKEVGLHRVFHDRVAKDPNLHSVSLQFRKRGLALGRRLVERFGGACTKRDTDAAAEVVVGLLEFCTHVGILYPASVTPERASAAGIDMLVAYFSATRRP